METKVGSFEWIASYSEIRAYFAWVLDYHKARGFTSPIDLLEIGCGTSGISERLQEDFPCLSVIATDFDEACVRHLRRQYPHSSTRYEILDILSEHETHQVKFNNFDCILDKGTYDALLVEGSIVQVIENINRFLRDDGCYLLFSIHPIDFMSNYFASPDCGLEILRLESMIIAEKPSHCTVALLKKSSSRPFRLVPFAQFEKEMLDQYYQEENPLLTPQMEMTMRLAFASVKDANIGLPLTCAYEVIFDPELDYEYTLFLEDLERMEPPLQNPGYITLSEALRFLEEMQ